MNMPIEILILFILAGYFLIGASQIFVAFQMKKGANSVSFPSKDFFVSVIIPIKEVQSTTKQHLESACKQNYPNFEVIFVAEVVEDPAYGIAMSLAQKYPNTMVLLSGRHDRAKTIGKCHNLVCATKHAKGDVLLFGDSDVTYSRKWIRKMTSPLEETVDGRCIEAVTSPFFIEPDGFMGKFIALSVSLVTFTASFTRQNQRFPSYASGASIAVTRELFDDIGLADIWASSFNDDLVFAVQLIDQGSHIYSQLANLNHPSEAFSDLRQTKEKLIRWVVTISTFSHRNLRAEMPIMVAKNLQFQAALIMALVLYLFDFPLVFLFGVVVAGYIYLVVYRWVVGKIIEERGLCGYHIIAPISITAMILLFVIVRMFYRSFSWGGKKYAVKGRHSG